MAQQTGKELQGENARKTEEKQSLQVAARSPQADKKAAPVARPAAEAQRRKMRPAPRRSRWKTAAPMVAIFLLGALPVLLLKRCNHNSLQHGKAEGVEARSSCPDERHPHAVDLGLPSGALWSCCNVGSSSPYDAGLFFAWGEARGGAPGSMSFDEDANVYVDEAELTAINDAACVNCSGEWKMPTRRQLGELLDHVTAQLRSHEGRSGYLLKSKVNGRCIFLPAAGYLEHSAHQADGELGRYWSRSADKADSLSACCLKANRDSIVIGSGPRYQGLTVRPVYSPKVKDEPKEDDGKKKAEKTDAQRKPTKKDAKKTSSAKKDAKKSGAGKKTEKKAEKKGKQQSQRQPSHK